MNLSQCDEYIKAIVMCNDYINFSYIWSKSWNIWQSLKETKWHKESADEKLGEGSSILYNERGSVLFEACLVRESRRKCPRKEKKVILDISLETASMLCEESSLKRHLGKRMKGTAEHPTQADDCYGITSGDSLIRKPGKKLAISGSSDDE
ncbi:unnamed protein product [Cylicocyclus nassatus]|uniref:Uncharacterized protein n=1 Tax=Cylicocyclus nassatus TaxID=53992 RepID=A0AA36H512_CYLNA|nr:unnamed protein product [Cylicocyclus nassatus]